jgi:adenylate kinase
MLASRGTPLEVVLSLEADWETLRQRVEQRLICTACGHIVSVGLHVANEQTPCPVCGGQLGKRADDNLQTLERRMEQYTARTLPLVSYYESASLLRRIDSARAPELVFQAVSEVLEQE